MNIVLTATEQPSDPHQVAQPRSEDDPWLGESGSGQAQDGSGDFVDDFPNSSETLHDPWADVPSDAAEEVGEQASGWLQKLGDLFPDD